MIVDHLSHIDPYAAIDPLLAAGLRFLCDEDLPRLPLGRADIDGDRVYALVQEYRTRAEADCRWESHRRYRDVQFIVSGIERIGVSQLSRVQLVTPYDEARDVAFYAGAGDSVTLHAGMLAVLWPHDIHRPQVAAGAPSEVRKIVLKVALPAVA